MTYTIIVFITLLLLFSSIKKKRQAAKYVSKVEEEEFEVPILTMSDVEEDGYVDENSNLESDTFEQPFVDTENENLEEISAKNASYFTYEAPAADDASNEDDKAIIAQQTHENELQNTENEEEKIIVDLKNPEELKKAIIYKEILQNPYI